ncbi:MAG: hypothetical protein M3430_02560 [Acidobacteriota bacterium]|nr:hypothetical protein [Acidobacteriota bacterium]
MLKIRPEQIEVFQPQAEVAFIERLMAHLRQEHASVVGRLPDDVLKDMVESGLTRARQYGLTWESNLTAFVALMFEVAPNFDEHPLIQRILTDENVPPDDRIDVLIERTTEQNWEAAKEGYDADAWFPELREGEE